MNPNLIKMIALHRKIEEAGKRYHEANKRYHEAKSDISLVCKEILRLEKEYQQAEALLNTK